jgi:hypothetical protein
MTIRPAALGHVKSAMPQKMFNPLNTELNPICHLLALVGVHPVLHISRIRVKPPKYYK